ncbi:hypothetical protein ACRALDRAFT_2107131, partial [Sodiomyces alcalophilus JCM 7366]|uniref:uncharacterized protein n=1 Tax=Sodiomyces alcalophilus JCM 7366 TaxID=591952 RepID=UPI0039B3B7BB
YGLEIMYFAWLLYPDISDKKVSEAILKGGLIRYVTTGSGYKAINLLIKYINASYTLDIKHNKNSIHDISLTFKRLALNRNYIAIIYKAVEGFLRTKQKGTYTYRKALNQIIEYAYKLYNNIATSPRRYKGPTFNTPNIYKLS